MVPWKILEKTVAKELQGYRIHRGGDFSESAPDVLATMKPGLSTFGLDISKEVSDKILIVVECKYRQSQPWINYYNSIIEEQKLSYYPILSLKYTHPITNAATNLLFGEYKDFFCNLVKREPIKVDREIPGYIDDYYRQVCEQVYTEELRMKFIFKYILMAKADLDLRSKYNIPVVVMAKANAKIKLAMLAEHDLQPLLAL